LFLHSKFVRYIIYIYAIRLPLKFKVADEKVHRPYSVILEALAP